MSTTPKYNIVKNINRGDRSRADMMKLIVATILEMDSNLVLVKSETSSNDYYATLRVKDSNVGFRVSSNTSFLSQNGCFKADGSWVAGKYSNGRSYFWDGTIFTVGHYSIGNCYSGFFCYNNHYNYPYVYLCGSYGQFVHSTGEKEFFASNTLSFPIESSTTLLYNPELDTYEMVSFGRLDGSESLVVNSKYDYLLMPCAYIATTPTRAFVNLRWGGEHKLYRLRNATGFVTADLGETVVINGKQTLCTGGGIIYAE